MKKFRLNSKGFNLVELLVVMAIIAVLVGILIYTINAARLQQRNTQRRSIMNTARAALEAYYAKAKDYPGSIGSTMTVTSMLTSGGALNLYAPGIDAANSEDPSSEPTRLCYSKKSRTQYYMYAVTEPSNDPGSCSATDPAGDATKEDFSVR